ncbi:MAG: Type restriction enzyme protein [Verrucomicrobiota bacterium]|jgi:type I restriction enzyme R subunit
MQNPTLVVLSHRNGLDDQLFGQFQRCADVLGQTPVQASGRERLRGLLNRASGGVVFTTIHKFAAEKGELMPELSARQNIVVIADEAHRSQYGFGGKVNEKTGEMSYGFASNLRDALPNASFIGFTGTPIEKTDANTRAVEGNVELAELLTHGSTPHSGPLPVRGGEGAAPLQFGLLHSHFP